MPNITDEQLVAYVLNELDADARAQVERAMKADDGVVARLAEFDGLTRQVAHAAQVGDADAHLRPEQREALLDKQPGALRRPSIFSNRSVRIAAIAAIAIAAALGIRVHVENLAGAPLMLAGIPDASEREGADAQLFRRMSDVVLEERAASFQEAEIAERVSEAEAARESALGASFNDLGGLAGIQNVDVGGQVAIRWNHFAPEDTADMGQSGGFGGLPPGGAGGGGFGGGGGLGADGIEALGYLGSSSDGFEGGINVTTNGVWESEHTFGLPPNSTFSFRPRQNTTRERYATIPDSPFVSVADQPLSTFGLDVDTASFTNVRRMLEAGQRPPREAVRVEEFINYLDYAYAEPEDGRPVALYLDAAQCPWQPDHRLVRVGVKAREVAETARPAANLVFLLDISGSMDSPDKLPLLQHAMMMLSQQLRADDNVAIAVYNSNAWVHLPPTSGGDRETITESIGALRANGSTNGAGGLELAYQLAAQHRVPDGINRVILATDGDFNTGTTEPAALQALVERERERGVFFTVLGFGTGNLNDSMLERIADHGNGQYIYVDSFDEIRRALVDDVVGTLHTVAKDVKIQVEFNPEHVSQYRLIGYENRALANADFRNDRKDAGDLGAGHTVTALYEVVPASAARTELRYQPEAATVDAAPRSAEWLTASLRYKEPDESEGQELAKHLADAGPAFEDANPGLRAAAAAAALGMILRNSAYVSSATLEDVVTWASSAADSVQRTDELIALARMAAAPQVQPAQTPTPSFEPEIRLLQIMENRGEWRARLRTGVKTYWVSEGEKLETWSVLHIDPENQTVSVFIHPTREYRVLKLEE